MMATLTRPKIAPRSVTSPPLSSEVPSPFPREQLEQVRQQDQPSPADQTTFSPTQHHEDTLSIPAQRPAQSRKFESTLQEPESAPSGVLNDLMPSIAYVQKSCLMTLNNLLQAPTRWHPIVPDRRHSMPSSPQDTTAHQGSFDSSSSALQTLVSNLRNRQSTGSSEMIEARESELIHELRVRVADISSTSLEPSDSILANALVSLLSHFHRLSVIQAPPFQTPAAHDPLLDTTTHDPPPPIDLFDALKRQLNDLQVERLSSQSGSLTPAGAPPVLAVEVALLWTQIDKELEEIVTMCKERTEALPRFTADNNNLPPKYDAQDYELEYPPDYEPGSSELLDDAKSREHHHSSADEKMRLDLEAVTMAIDRLYLVAPQLHNQRVELKSSKVAQMEKARREGSASASASASSSRPTTSKGKGKEKDVQELEALLDMIGKASERSIHTQSVVLEGGMQSRLEKAKARDMAKKEKFVEQLALHSNAGRIHGQDAILSPPRIKDPEAMLTLPEFIRESIPRSAELLSDPQAMLTLPEFVKEPPPIRMNELEYDLPPFPNLKSKKKGSNRSRSLSAPPLAWLRSASSSSKSGLASAGVVPVRLKSRGMSTGFDVVYVAENHESLRHILVFFTVTGATPGVDIEAEVLPPFPEHPMEGGDHLVIRSGSNVSLPLMLPGKTTPGKKEVKVQSGHYELKLHTVSSSNPQSDAEESPILLGAHELSAAQPTSFLCASCSLPLVLSSKIKSYRDLPSEHWEELVEAWMCHSDQKLHDQVMQRSKSGFWPEEGQALVGGSYVLFEESSMSKNNLFIADEMKPEENWRLVRCICGAVIGRCQERQAEAEASPTAYRVLKYAIRPVSSIAEPMKISLSAFIVQDMNEFVQAHASYRFVIRDEENELPRILIWLFKPNIRIAYTTPTSRAIPKSASIHGAKVLYKLLNPSEASMDLKSILNKYPGFPQAEYLSYPMAICRRLAGLLKESNSAYPNSLRMMTGLEVGWLHRV
ncbi:HECT-like ubiquitin-conjugating enzyme-binding-domain-containing protein [Crucibulum laeve]|uniref:HECT-like ubiquitin-conjugating enzyme-binding-domain-containing protein n=1 Tax=Crucibulum laeve TaxID=68775 RepID=A0A5C3M1F3_9AGAR|nr:HECT-like ubiquitin-conjugating enzyme-binding-domain-containing protein [Crucibulum laeve]